MTLWGSGICALGLVLGPFGAVIECILLLVLPSFLGFSIGRGGGILGCLPAFLLRNLGWGLARIVLTDTWGRAGVAFWSFLHFSVHLPPLRSWGWGKVEGLYWCFWAAVAVWGRRRLRMGYI